MHSYFDMIWRTILAFVALLVISRILGKQTISNMTFHDFATGIMMGAIAANLAFNHMFPILFLLACLAVLALTSYIASIFSLKFPRTRHLLAGEPTMLINDGKILENNMRQTHYTLDSLNQSLRQKNIFNLNEVKNAILETNGELSIQRKEQFEPVTRKDLNLPEKKIFFPVELVMDGKLMKKNLRENDIPEKWFLSQIAAQGKELEQIFYAVRTSNGKLIFDCYKDGLHHPIDKE